MTGAGFWQITTASTHGFDAAIAEGMVHVAEALHRIKGVWLRDFEIEVASGPRLYRVTILLLTE